MLRGRHRNTHSCDSRTSSFLSFSSSSLPPSSFRRPRSQAGTAAPPRRPARPRGRRTQPEGKGSGRSRFPPPPASPPDSRHKGNGAGRRRGEGGVDEPHTTAGIVSLSVHLPGEGAPAEPPCPPRFSKPEEPGSHPCCPACVCVCMTPSPPTPRLPLPPPSGPHPLLARAAGEPYLRASLLRAPERFNGEGGRFASPSPATAARGSEVPERPRAPSFPPLPTPRVQGTEAEAAPGRARSARRAPTVPGSRQSGCPLTSPFPPHPSTHPPPSPRRRGGAQEPELSAKAEPHRSRPPSSISLFSSLLCPAPPSCLLPFLCRAVTATSGTRVGNSGSFQTARRALRKEEEEGERRKGPALRGGREGWRGGGGGRRSADRYGSTTPRCHRAPAPTRAAPGPAHRPARRTAQAPLRRRRRRKGREGGSRACAEASGRSGVGGRCAGGVPAGRCSEGTGGQRDRHGCLCPEAAFSAQGRRGSSQPRR